METISVSWPRVECGKGSLELGPGLKDFKYQSDLTANMTGDWPTETSSDL